jgi:hypothetical protein
MTSVGFEPEIPASERPQTNALDRAATGIGYVKVYLSLIKHYFKAYEMVALYLHTF